MGTFGERFEPGGYSDRRVAERVADCLGPRWNGYLSLAETDCDDADFGRVVDELTARGLGSAVRTLDLRITRISGKGLTHLGRLCSLAELFLDRGQVDAASVDRVRELDSLTRLYLPVTNLASHQLAPLCRLDLLETLQLRGRRLCAEDLRWVSQIASLCHLDLTYTPVDADALTELGALPRLTGVSLGKTSTGDEHLAAIAGLHGLTGLGLERAQITDEGLKRLSGMTELKRVALDGTAIGDEGIRQLAGHRKLEWLRLIDCRRITDLSPLWALLPPAGSLDTLMVSGCAALKLPDGSPARRAITLQSKAAAIFRAMADAAWGDELHAARVILLGEGGHGKTHLWLRLADRFKAVRPVYERTIGFEVARVVLSQTDYANLAVPEVGLGVFDCGGQHEQYTAHQMLLDSERNVFVLCLHAGKDFRRGNRGEYYLRMIREYSPQAPVVIVVTHGELAGPRRKLRLPSQAKCQTFHDGPLVVVDPYSSVKLGTAGEAVKSIDDVRAALAECVNNLSGLRQKLGKPIVNLRALVREHFGLDGEDPWHRQAPIERAQMGVGLFTQLCEEAGQPESDQYPLYLYTLHSLGDVICPNARKVLAKKRLDEARLILNPCWVRRHLYGVLTDEQAKQDSGFMTAERFESLVNDVPAGQRELFREVLRDSGIIYPWNGIRPDGVEETRGHLVPDLLPTRDRRSASDGSGGVRCGASLRFARFLAEGLLLRFIADNRDRFEPLALTASEKAKYGPQARGVFKNEVAVRQDGCVAVVRADVIDRTMAVSVSGPTKAAAGALCQQVLAELQGKRTDGDVTERWEQDGNLAASAPTHQSEQTNGGQSATQKEKDDRLRAAVRKMLREEPDGLSAPKIHMRLTDSGVSDSEEPSGLRKKLGRWPEFKLVGGGSRQRWVLSESRAARKKF